MGQAGQTLEVPFRDSHPSGQWHLCLLPCPASTPSPSALTPVRKGAAWPLCLQISPYFFTSNWVLLLDSGPSENLAEIFQVPGLRTDKGGTQPTCAGGLGEPAPAHWDRAVGHTGG